MWKHEYYPDGSIKRSWDADEHPEWPGDVPRRPLRKMASADANPDADDLFRELLGELPRDVPALRPANLPPVDPELADLLPDFPE